MSIAKHTVENEWVKPEISSTRGINIKGGRHPVVEQDVDFVSNDSTLGNKYDFTIVTGPNMAGKSTYLRQTALIVLLSHIGSYVPASSAKIGVVDGIYTRVGAMDEISKGRSTFMVEMSELANILHSSTDNSLVILDEVGRGTATYDGISIAQSTIEYLTDRENTMQTPMTLFATHYHELTSMSKEYSNLRNVHVAVESGESKEDYEFIRRVREGSADKSYGIRVADIAGVPDPVIDRSEDILSELRQEDNQKE
jgi:DNA mismatch repair protein MutS